jgi:hypothetical protein
MASFTVNLLWKKKGIHMQVEVNSTTSWGEVKAVFKERYASETKDVDPDFHGNPDSATMQDLGVNAKKSTMHLNVPLAFVQWGNRDPMEIEFRPKARVKTVFIRFKKSMGDQDANWIYSFQGKQIDVTQTTTLGQVGVMENGVIMAERGPKKECKLGATNDETSTSGAKPTSTSGAKPTFTSGATPTSTSEAKPTSFIITLDWKEKDRNTGFTVKHCTKWSKVKTRFEQRHFSTDLHLIYTFQGRQILITESESQTLADLGVEAGDVIDVSHEIESVSPDPEIESVSRYSSGDDFLEEDNDSSHHSEEEEQPSEKRKRKKRKKKTTTTKADDDSSHHSEEEEQPSKKRKRKKRGKRPKRIPDSRPQGARQQMDVPVRDRVDTVAEKVVLVRNMSTPYCRTDEYADERGERESETESVIGERTWPMVAFGMCCVSGQKPNPPGNSNESLHKKQLTLHIEIGSQVDQDTLIKLLDEKVMDIQVHACYQTFRDSIFLHESIIDKKPIVLKATSKGRKSSKDQQRL